MRKTIGHDLLFFVLTTELIISLLWPDHLFVQILFFFFFLLIITVYHLGKTLIILEAIVLFAIIQWLIAPLIIYFYLDTIELMAVPEQRYFQITFPATILMAMGLFFPYGRSSHRPKLNFKKSDIGLILGLIGLVAYFIRPFVPLVLVNLFFLASQLMYIGVLYSFFSKASYKWYVLFAVLGVTLLNITKEGMFTIPLMWGFFFTIFYFIQTKRGLVFKLSAGAAAIFILLGVQTLKIDYRKGTWSDGGRIKKANISLLGSILWEKLSKPQLLIEEKSIFGMLDRINQGYIISQTINHVPRSEPFARGETVVEGIAASIIPRIFWPNKPKAGGGEMYPRFTGRELPGRTSMNISPMGEAYVNFGKNGGMVFMFFFGLFMKISFSMCLKLARAKPFFLFWIPLIFFASIFLGTDLNSILNTMTKAAMFTWLFYWFGLLFLKLKIF